MNVFVCVPGRDSVRGGPRQPASTCRSVRTTCEPWTCLMNSAMLSLTTWLKDNTWASNTPQLSSSSSVVAGDDSKCEWIRDTQSWVVINLSITKCFIQWWTVYHSNVNLPIHLDICLTALSTMWLLHRSQQTALNSDPDSPPSSANTSAAWSRLHSGSSRCRVMLPVWSIATTAALPLTSVRTFSTNIPIEEI